MVAPALLEYTQVSLKLGGRQILSQVSFSVHPGEYLSVIGQNGSGKTTLLRCGLGMFRADSGTILLLGRPVQQYTQRERARIVSYVPQQLDLIFPMTAYEFVLLARYPHLGFMQSLGRRDEAAARRALELCGGQEFAARPVHSLSGGERQRILIAAALTQEPRVLLLDEVSHFLDPQHEAEVQALLQRLNVEHGMTIVSVTHDINRAAFHSSRVLALRDGRVIFDGVPRQLMENGYLETIYGKKFLFVQHPQKNVRVVVPEL